MVFLIDLFCLLATISCMFTDVSWVPAIRSEVLTCFFKWMPYLVHLDILLIAIGLGYWCWNRVFCRDLSLVMLFSTMALNMLKVTFKLPRPTIEHIISIRDHSYTFPSGDALVATTFWLMLAFHFKKTWFSLFSAIIILCVMCSRVYFGVHYPRDVLVGALLGVCSVVFYRSQFCKKIMSFLRNNLWSWVLLVVLWSALYTKVVVFSQKTPLHTITLGLFLGINAGFILLMATRSVPLFTWYNSPTNVTTAKIFFALFSFGTILLLKEGLMITLPTFLPDMAVSKALTYTFIGLYLSSLSFFIYHSLFVISRKRGDL